MSASRKTTHSWLDRPVLITGINGFVGSWLAESLLEEGAHVIGLSRREAPRSELFSKVTFVQGSVADGALLEETLKEHEIDTVFHLAAQAIVGKAEKGPIGTFETNIRGTWNVLDACRNNREVVSRVILASSDRAYGSLTGDSIDETTPLQGTSPYDVSKSCSDMLARCYFETYRLPICSIRCGNLFGGRDLNFDRIIPGTIRSILEGEQPVIRSDGKNVRDYLYVRDVVDGYMRLAEKMDDPAIHGEAFNFSGEKPLSVLDLTNLILGLMDRSDLSPVVLNFSQAEARQQMSSEKARARLGWQPRSILEDALLETIDWYRTFLHEDPSGPCSFEKSTHSVPDGL